uniref:Uncharacterized protein n=1 Tax=Timema poppense TaxID=170557 RepID=A0A7R9H028_TIMPO|nr:unnamed protein product [Timema poppensis]
MPTINISARYLTLKRSKPGLQRGFPHHVTTSPLARPSDRSNKHTGFQTRVLAMAAADHMGQWHWVEKKRSLTDRARNKRSTAIT